MTKNSIKGGIPSGGEMIHAPVFRTLNASDIECRTCNVSPDKKKVKLLLYKDARVDMSILDETVGADRWQRLHEEVKGNLYCKVGIKTIEGEWVWKSDCGIESNMEQAKGEASDAFKRACFCWGIGRELYTTPIISIDLTDKDFFKDKFCQSFSVKEIEVSPKHEITYLTIVDRLGKERFEWGKKKPHLTSKQYNAVLKRLSDGEDIWESLRAAFTFDEDRLRSDLKKLLEEREE
jgi:hypothetical protein